MPRVSSNDLTSCTTHHIYLYTLFISTCNLSIGWKEKNIDFESTSQSYTGVASLELLTCLLRLYRQHHSRFVSWPTAVILSFNVIRDPHHLHLLHIHPQWSPTMISTASPSSLALAPWWWLSYTTSSMSIPVKRSQSLSTRWANPRGLLLRWRLRSYRPQRETKLEPLELLERNEYGEPRYHCLHLIFFYFI